MRKRYDKTLGTSEINSAMSPPSLWIGPIVIINKMNLHCICIDQPMMFLLQHKQSPHRSLSPRGDYKPHLKYYKYFQKNKRQKKFDKDQIAAKLCQNWSLWRHKNEVLSISFLWVFFPTSPLISLIFITSHGLYLRHFVQLLFISYVRNLSILPQCVKDVMPTTYAIFRNQYWMHTNPDIHR